MRMRACFMLVSVSLAIWVIIGGRRLYANKTARTKITPNFHFSSPKPTRAKITEPPSTPCYTRRCHCNGESTICRPGTKDQYITYFPRVPAETRLFRMWRADLPTLTSHMLANLSNFDIETLNLAVSNISHVEKDAFKEFTKLKTLILSGNPISVADLQQAFLSMSKVLEKILLPSMNFTHLPEDFFEGFSNRTFTMVDLQNNSLAVLDNSVFAKFWQIDTLDISSNKLSSVKLTQRVHVRKLKLGWRELMTFPDFCLQRTTTRQNETEEEGGGETENAFVNLHSLDLAIGILKEIPPFRGKCLPSLTKLDIGAAAVVDTLRDNLIADLPKLQYLTVAHMPELKYYNPYAFNSTSLKKLILRNNGKMRSDYKYIHLHLFRHCPNLEILTIRSTKINMRQKGFMSLLVELKSVQTLVLDAISYGNIPEDLLWRLPNLKRLEYTGNSMTSKGLELALMNVTTLKFLNVRSNSITVVNETTLPWEFRRNVKEINLAQNPFMCTCDLLWFRKWLDDVAKNGTINVTDYPSALYLCRTPAPDDRKFKHLSEFRPTDESCAIKNPYIVIGLAIGCLVAMGTVLGGLCYRYRWHLRFYVYRLRRTRYLQGFESNTDGGGELISVYNYDVYLAHSASDLDWIHDELLPLLEGKHSLKTFVEERDTVGGYIGDNIARYMDDSARIMLVLSDHYNHEGWRKCEFEHILYSAFEFNKDVIVLLLGEVKAGRMTKDMRSMLTRGTFLQWGPSEDAKRHFRDGLKVALKTQDVNFAQILC